MGIYFRATVLALAVVALSLSTLPSDAKKWTITERQTQLNKEIDQGIKSGDLTSKEGEKLKNESADITVRISKAKNKNDGKLSVPDQNKIEKDLNKLSLNIQKKKLEKRTQ